MSLVAILCSLPTEKIAEIQTAIIEAGLRAEFKTNHKPIFKRLRDQSKGKAKKIYAALAGVDHDQMRRLSDIICDYKREQYEKTQNQSIIQRPIAPRLTDMDNVERQRIQLALATRPK